MIESRLKENQKRLQYTPYNQHTKGQLYAFGALQVLDIYTTYRGLKYDCVKELNPILGERPSLSTMAAFKTVALYPVIESDIKREVLDQRTMRKVNTMMFMVIANNNSVKNGAKRNCLKL